MRQAVKISECAFDQPFKWVEVLRPLCHHLFIFKFPTDHSCACIHVHVCSITGFYSKLLKPCVELSICFPMNKCTQKYIIPPLASSGVFLVHQRHSPFANGLIRALLRSKACCLHRPKWPPETWASLIYSSGPTTLLLLHNQREWLLYVMYIVWWTVVFVTSTKMYFLKIAGW